MAKEIKKSDGPACACGRGDLYDEWKKLNEGKKEEGFESTDPKRSDDVVKDEHKQEQAKNETKNE